MEERYETRCQVGRGEEPGLGVARIVRMRTPVFDTHVDSLQRALDLGDDLGTVTGGHLRARRQR